MTLILHQINLCILQASMVEDVVPLSGLDRVQELTCVSVLACCLDDFYAQFLISNQRFQPVYQRNPPASIKSGDHFSGMPVIVSCWILYNSVSFELAL